jgi:hypothetical protein
MATIMLGILLQGIGSFFGEISGSLEKWMVTKRVESFYAVGFQNCLVAIAFFLAYVFCTKGSLRLNPESYPTLALLIILSIAQAYATMKGAVIASRGTFNFIRVGTMPLMLIFELFIGCDLSSRQISGIVLIMCALVYLYMNHGIERKGAGLVAFTAVNSAVTLELYKWHVTIWNSVAAEQLILIVAQTIFFYAGAVFIAKENPFRLLRKRLPLFQSASYATADFLGSFAYLFAPASVILAAARSSSVLWGILFGNRFFHEKGLALKITTFVIVTIGIVLLVR